MPTYMFQSTKQAFPNIHRLLSIFKISTPSHHPVFNRWVHKCYCLIQLCQQAMNYSARHAGPSSSLQPLLGSPHWTTTLCPNNYLFPIYMGKITTLVEPNHTDSMRNWNPQRKGLPWLFRWTATTAGNVKNRRGFTAILCLKDRNTCLCLQQQRKHLLMKTAQTSHSSRNWNLDPVSWLMQHCPHPLPEDEKRMQDLQLLKWYANPLLLPAASTIHMLVLFSSLTLV